MIDAGIDDGTLTFETFSVFRDMLDALFDESDGFFDTLTFHYSEVLFSRPRGIRRAFSSRELVRRARRRSVPAVERALAQLPDVEFPFILTRDDPAEAALITAFDVFRFDPGSFFDTPGQLGEVVGTIDILLEVDVLINESENPVFEGQSLPILGAEATVELFEFLNENFDLK